MLGNICSKILGVKQYFCSNSCGAQQDCYSNCSYSIIYLEWNVGEHLFKHSGCEAKPLFKNLGMFGTNILGAKQDFCADILDVRQYCCSNICGAQQDCCSNCSYSISMECWGTFVQTFWVQSNTFAQNFGVVGRKHFGCKAKSFVQTFCAKRKTCVQTFP